MAMQWYGDYVAFAQEPNEEMKEDAIRELAKALQKDEYNVDWDSMQVIYKEPGENDGPFSEIYDEKSGKAKRITKIWTLAIKVKAERK